jgi:hypothetical protein
MQARRQNDVLTASLKNLKKQEDSLETQLAQLELA